jgi:hypothetical protein
MRTVLVYFSHCVALNTICIAYQGRYFMNVFDSRRAGPRRPMLPKRSLMAAAFTAYLGGSPEDHRRVQLEKWRALLKLTEFDFQRFMRTESELLQYKAEGLPPGAPPSFIIIPLDGPPPSPLPALLFPPCCLLNGRRRFWPMSSASRTASSSWRPPRRPSSSTLPRRPWNGCGTTSPKTRPPGAPQRPTGPKSRGSQWHLSPFNTGLFHGIS